MMIVRRLESEDPGIQDMIFEELTATFGTNCEYYSGCRESRYESFIGIIADLGKIRRNESNDTIRARVFTQLESLNCYLLFPAVCEFIEIFYQTFHPSGSEALDRPRCFDGPVTQRIIKHLCRLTLQEATTMKTKLAAFQLIGSLTNPYTKKWFDAYKEKFFKLKQGLSNFEKIINESLVRQLKVIHSSVEYKKEKA